jgi:hypothetical protein
MIEPPKGPFCQSCGMPLAKPEDFVLVTTVLHFKG